MKGLKVSVLAVVLGILGMVSDAQLAHAKSRSCAPSITGPGGNQWKLTAQTASGSTCVYSSLGPDGKVQIIPE